MSDRLIQRLRALCLAVLFGMFAAAPVMAAETIRSFSTNVQLNVDGSVRVVETIQVRAEGDKIRRGIYRDIPTVLINDDGSRLRSNLDVLAVSRGGQPERWFTEGIENGTRIYIGDAEVFLSPGVYTYTIEYTMTRQARRFETNDELFWNATGNFWDFPIAEAVARIELPAGADISNATGFTGAFGSTEQAVEITRPQDNVAVFRATRPLNAYEGMSVAVSFDKGVLTEPGTTQQALYWLSDHRNLIVPAIAVFLVLLYYFFSWDAVGRDPKRGTIIPLFYPPEGYSPALTHYIWAMGWKKNGWLAFTAAIVDLAVKGLITVKKEGKKTRLSLAKSTNQLDLPAGEAVIYAHINAKGSILIDKDTGPDLGDKKSDFIELLQTESRGTYFNNNTGYTVFGVALSIACLVAMIALGVLGFEWVIVSLFVGAVGLLFSGVLSGPRTGAFGAQFLFRMVVLAAIGFNFFATAIDVSNFGVFEDISFDTAGISAISIVAINVLFAMLMRAPTMQGRKVMDQIEGFRMYLETAEKERLNFSNEPEMTVARFEKVLPYAIALGVEKPWTERFENDLARNAVRGMRGNSYQPVWYAGSNFSSSNLSRDVSAMATGMSAAMIAAQPASSSSSGFSSGGSSGGGGGGGGGGGW